MQQEISRLEEEYSNRILGHTRPRMNLHFEGLFRSRIIEEKDIINIKTVAEIWYYDQLQLYYKKRSYGRCHSKDENFFYSSNSLEATILELQPKDKNIILSGVFKLRSNRNPPIAVFAGIECLKGITEYNVGLEKYTYAKEIDREFEHEIAERFQTQITNSNRDEYYHTIALTHILLKNSEHQCIIYPSVASNYRLVNYGFKSAFVDENLYCEDIGVFLVEKSQSFYILKPVLWGNIIQNQNVPKDSNIQWLTPLTAEDAALGTFRYPID